MNKLPLKAVLLRLRTIRGSKIGNIKRIEQSVGNLNKAIEYIEVTPHSYLKDMDLRAFENRFNIKLR